MNYIDFNLPVMNYGITLSEIPNRIAVFFEIGDCILNCENCHSPNLSHEKYDGTTMNVRKMIEIIKHYYSLGADAIVFMGGLRSNCVSPSDFIKCVLSPLYEKGYDIGMYDGSPGFNNFNITSMHFLKWIKIGNYIETLGPLTEPNTNQFFLEKNDGWEDKTYEYFKKEGN